MSEISALVEALKRHLRTRRMTYKTLAERLDLSEIAVKKMFAARNMTLQRLSDICSLIGITIHELSLSAQEDAEKQATVLTEEQELALAADPRLLAVFYLVMNRWSFRAIQKRYKLEKPELIKLLLELDRLGLIELDAGNAIRLRTIPNIRWAVGGPIHARYETEALQEFLGVPFAGEACFFDFFIYQFSQASRTAIIKKMQKLQQEVLRMAEVDGSLPPEEKENCGILWAHRTWHFTPLRSLG